MERGFKRKMSLAVIILIVFMLLANGCSQTSAQGSVKTKTITDMAGRVVEVPTEIDSVYCTSPVGQIMVYTISPDLIAGLNYEASDVEKEYLTSNYTSLPVLGGWYGKGYTGNLEEIAKAKPDIIINAGTISDETITFSDDLQKQLGIPVVFAEVNLDTMADSYNFLGDLLNQTGRTNKLAAYINVTINEAKAKVANIKEEDKIRVYYAEGAKGLLTDPAGSSHTQVLDMLAGINVADVQITGGYGRAEVSPEQIITWDPDLIIAGLDAGDVADGAAYDNMQSDSVLKDLRAIKSGAIYEVPCEPYSWFDRPPSANMIMGIKWTAQVLYPEIFNYDIRKETKEFYKLFYDYDLSDAQLDELLSRSVEK
ncbi:ABC transporter substrate-binding protein [Acetobacterium bakii]|uniref:Fe/B12 periplasmic-binding domain-containing protein n=1 Tax=Acetobacterium bakii TaxID=52689 RepID=A0A0L6TXT5_9FIRM|nr:ABC transporter substrate-binding protein [Acetobacterium bakii]KNZ40370.1 hypothetical protein AKG39_17985 [Acetobacterium bakii]